MAKIAKKTVTKVAVLFRLCYICVRERHLKCYAIVTFVLHLLLILLTFITTPTAMKHDCNNHVTICYIIIGLFFSGLQALKIKVLSVNFY